MAATAAGLAAPAVGADQRAEIERLAALRAQRRILEQRLHTLGRVLPPEFDEAAEMGRLQALAAKAGLPGLQLKALPGPERIALREERPSPLPVHRVVASGQAPYEAVHMFMSYATLSARMVAIEALEAQAAPKGTVNFTVRLALPVWPAFDAVPVPRSLAEGIAAEQAGIDRLQTLIIDAGELAQRKALPNALAAVMKDLDDSALAFSSLRFERELVLEGVAVGTARERLRPALERAGLAVAGVRWAQAGRCRRFTVSSHPGEDPREFEAVLGNGLFDADGVQACAAASPSPPPLPPLALPAGGGPLVVLARGADVGDVFRMLHEATGEDFVLDPDVAGTLAVSIDGATLEQVLSALPRVGLVVGPGPLRRVSRQGRPAGAGDPAPGVRYSGDPVSLSFKDADLRDLLRLLQEISGLQVTVAPEVQGRVSVFADGVPWDLFYDVVLAARGYETQVAGTRVTVRPRPGARGIPSVAAAPVAAGRLRTASLPLAAFAPDDLALAGIVKSGSGWKAYAWAGPGGALRTLETGLELDGARIAAIGPSGVTIVTDAGQRTEVRLQP